MKTLISIQFDSLMRSCLVTPFPVSPIRMEEMVRQESEAAR